MEEDKKYAIIIAIISAICFSISFFISPIFGGPVLFWIFLIPGIFFGLIAAILVLPKSNRAKDNSELIDEIRDLAYQINSWTFDDGEKKLNKLNRKAHHIGKELYKRGRKPLMLEVFQAAGSHRTIESAWDGIGNWRG